MSSTIYLAIVVALILLEYLLDAVTEKLNLGHIQENIPAEFEGYYDAEQYAKAQQYLRTTTRFGLLKSTVMLPVILAFILLGGFGWVDDLARGTGFGLIGTGLVFAGLLMLLQMAVGLPFSIYLTFVLEERFGFNRTTPKTFVLDLVKGMALTVILGGPLFAAITWFFAEAGVWAWLYAWAAVTVIQVVFMVIAPVVIMPLFNKFTPLPEGELRTAVEEYARQQRFALKGIFTMDGSKRSAKSNAYFTGIGRWRRVVFYDTLVEKHDVPELIGVLAHEVGHYKRKHIPQMLGLSMASSLLMFFILSLFLTQPGLYEAFQVVPEGFDAQMPVYAGIVLFGFLYTPISMLLGLIGNVLSRRWEYEADAFAVRTGKDADSFIRALKKLTVDNLGNLSPHPFKVFLEYSHPPVLDRIRAIRQSKDHKEEAAHG